MINIGGSRGLASHEKVLRCMQGIICSWKNTFSYTREPEFLVNNCFLEPKSCSDSSGGKCSQYADSGELHRHGNTIVPTIEEDYTLLLVYDGNFKNIVSHGS